MKEAKAKEVGNLVKYGVFEEVDDGGQEHMGSRWVITQKEKTYGQKAEFKRRLKDFKRKSHHSQICQQC